MGIYINGMEMPQNCSECAFCGYYGNGEHECDIIEKAVECESAKTKRRDDCPLVYIPPHGRLIDADALMKRISHMNMEEYMDGACYGIHPSMEYLDLLSEIIDDAPTIIPASEEGEK